MDFDFMMNQRSNIYTSTAHQTEVHAAAWMRWWTLNCDCSNVKHTGAGMTSACWLCSWTSVGPHCARARVVWLRLALRGPVLLLPSSPSAWVLTPRALCFPWLRLGGAPGSSRGFGPRTANHALFYPPPHDSQTWAQKSLSLWSPTKVRGANNLYGQNQELSYWSEEPVCFCFSHWSAGPVSSAATVVRST